MKKPFLLALIFLLNVAYSLSVHAGGNYDSLDPLNPGEVIKTKWDQRMLPIRWSFSSLGYPNSTFSNDEIISEITAAFDTWEALNTSFVTFSYEGEENRRTTRDDGINLVTFTDDDIEFPPGVAGLAVTYAFGQETVIDDTNNDLDGDGSPDIPNGTYPAGTIYDVNIAFNASLNYSISGGDGTADIRAIALHEVGHILGLTHSSIENTVMWPFLNTDIAQARTLARDDRAHISLLYAQEPDFSNQYGEITGRITNGANGFPVLGAHVFAVDVDTGEKLVGAYSGLDGGYVLPMEAGNYFVGIEPLDGDPSALNPARINSLIEGTSDIYFMEELFDANEASVESDPLAAVPVNVAVGATTEAIHLQTNMGSVPGVTRILHPGMNYFAFPVAAPSGLTAYDLLPVLGNETEINAIDRLNTQTQLFERVSYLNGQPVGENFPIVRGEGYIVHAQQQKAVTIHGSLDCPEVSLVAGLNIVAVPCPPATYSAFDLLEHLGSESEVVAVKRFDPETAGYEVAEYVGGIAAGEDFVIANGESYIAELRVDKSGVSVPGQGSIYPPAITSISPGVGIADDLVVIQGQGFSDNMLENSVSFNGINAHIVYASNNVIATVVPGNATTGPLIVTANGRVSNAVGFVIESATIDESTSGNTAMLPGQRATGQLSMDAEQDRYTFVALAGASLRVSAETVSGNTDLMLVLEGPSGAILISDDDSGPGREPAIRNYSLPQTGEYTLVVTAVSGAGSYTVDLEVLNISSAPQVSILHGGAQSALAGTALPRPFEVYVTGSTGQPLAGVPVTFTATDVDLAEVSQGFSLQNAGTAVITTNRYGIAVVEAVAPNVSGVFNIDVVVPGMDPVTVQVSTIATPVTQMIVSSQVTDCGGNGCEVGQPVSAPYSILYLDSSGQPVENAFTEWSVVSGGGSLGSFSPGASGSRQLTGPSGTVEVFHSLGEQLYFEIDGESTGIKLPQMVAASVPGQEAPVLFSAVSRAGPPDTIESARNGYFSMSISSAILNALIVRVTDQYGNPVAGVPMSYDGEEFDVYPGRFHGQFFPDFLTNEDGIWVGMVRTPNGMEPTQDEVGDVISPPYSLVLSAGGSVSASFDVDVDLIPHLFVTGGIYNEISAYAGQALDEPLRFRIARFTRVDQDGDGSWSDEDFTVLNTLAVEGVGIRHYVERGDGADPVAEGVAATTLNGQTEIVLTTDEFGYTEMDVELGDVGGGVYVSAEITQGFELPILPQRTSYFDPESFNKVAVGINSIPIVVRATIDAGALGGLDWQTLSVSLNGGTTIFDGSASEPPRLNTFPNFIRVYLDGAEQLVWPSQEMLDAGGFSRMEITYRPLASDVIDGQNTLEITADARAFDGTIETTTKTNTFGFNPNVPSAEWDIAASFNGTADFTIGRTISLAQPQNQPASTSGVAIGSYEIFNVPLAESSTVQVDILDADQSLDGTLISASSLSAGDHRFVLLREDIGSGIVPLQGRPDLFVRVQITPASTGLTREIIYSGELNDSVTGKILGQVIQHDTLLQDGSLSLRREDLALKGAGPQLSFIRSYSNAKRPENADTDLGPGWSHNHDVYVKVLARSDTAPDYGENLPGWISGTRSGFGPRFLSAASLSNLIQSSLPHVPSLVAVSNGGTFERNDSGQWVGQRGNHGTLTGTSGSGFVYTSKDGTEYTFNTSADNENRYKVAQVTDRNGNRLTYEYDQQRLFRVTDQGGRYLAFNYEFADNGRHRLTEVNAVVNGASSSENITLNFNYFRLASSNAEEEASHFDEVGMLQRFTRADFTERYDYEAENGDNEPNLVLAEDANGHITQYQYLVPADVPSNFTLIAPGTPRTDIMARVCYPSSSTSCSSDYAEFSYPTTSGNIREVTDLRGNTTRYELNPWGNPSRIEEPEGKITEFEWSIDLGEADNVMRIKRDLSTNATWEYEYDAQGNLTREVDPYDNELIQTWHPTYSILTSRVDKNGHTYTQELDSNGNVENEIRQAFVDGENTAVEVVVHHDYGTVNGIHGLRTSTTDARNNETTYDYDENGNVIEIDEPGDGGSTFEYNGRGMRIAEEDAEGNRSTYEYDDLDRLTYTRDAEGNSVEYEYDAKGNKTEENTRDRYRIGFKSYNRREILVYEYDARDRVVEITRRGNLSGNYLIGGQKSFTYDENSNIESETDWKGQTTTYTYDALNRRTSTTNRRDNTSTTVYVWVSGEGLQKTQTDFEAHETVEHYDLLGRLARVQHETVNHADNTVGNYERIIDYDAYENITSILDEENKLTRYEYDPRNLKIAKVDALGHRYEWEYDANGNLSKTIDEELNETSYEYDAQNRLIEKHQAEGHDWVYTYFPNDTLATKTDPWGFEYSYTYDGINQRTSSRDPDGVTLESYTKDGELVYRRDAEGRETSNLYGPAGRLQVATDARGRITTYSYDHNNNVTDKAVAWPSAATGPTVVREHYQYDALDRMTHHQEGFGSSVERSTQYEYDRQGNKTREINPDGRIVSYQYDELYRVKTIVSPATDRNLATNTLQKFDGVGNLVWVRDRRGNETRTDYDDLHRPTTVTDALEQSIITAYDNVGNVVNVTDKRGHSKETFYDDLYRVTEQFISDNAGTRFRLVFNEYDLLSSGRQDALTDANGNRVVTTADFRGNPLVTTLPAGEGYASATVQYAYDNAGLLTRTTDAAGFSTDRSYFADGRVASITDAENHITTYAYDLFGNQVVVTKPEGNAQTSTYDARNRLVNVEDDQGNITRFEYDVNSNLRYQYSPRAHASGETQVEYTYDTRNQKRSHIQHKAGGNLTTAYLYDAEGNLTQSTDANGQVFTYSYDALNRLTNEVFPANDDIISIVRTYDANNNPDTITETKPGSVVEVTDYDHDLLNRVTQHSQRGHSVNYTYDNNGNRTLVTAPGDATSYTYDSRNRLATVTAAGASASTTYSYLQNGWTDIVTHTNGTSVDYDYYDDGQIQNITNRSGETIVSSFVFEYDQNNNRIQQIETQHSFTNAQVLTTDYDYDTLDRLASYSETSADATHTASHVFTHFPSYDRATEVVTINGNEIKNRSFTYDDTYWLSSITDTADGGGTVTYTYDNNGNTLSKTDSTGNGPASTVFTYNRRNQLLTVASGDLGSEINQGTYHYKHDGMRIRHIGSDRGDIEYIYDGKSIIDEVQNGTSTQVAHYRYGDRLLSLNNGTEEQFYHYASLGTTANLSDASGQVQVSYRTDPFGAITQQEGTSINRQVFTGHEHDEETGLIYMKARFYDPDTGRFNNQDTYLGEPNNPPSLHRYNYAHSNPTYYTDPTGNFAVTEWLQKQFEAAGDSVREGAEDIHNSDSHGTVKAVRGAGARLLAGLHDTAATFAGAADEAIDIGLSALGDREILGQNSYQRTQQRLSETKAIAKNAVDATSAYLTQENLSGRIASDAEKAAGKGLEFGGKLIDGDSRAWSSVYAGSVSIGGGFAGIKTLLNKQGKMPEVDVGSVPESTLVPSYEELLLQAKNDLDFGTPRDGAVFWSSSDTTSNMRIAQDWAAERGKYTLEQTDGGKYLDELNLFGPDSSVTPQQAAEIWDVASLRFANEASGDLNVFSTRAKKLSKYGHIRTWWRIEKEALKNNDRVTSVTRRKLDGSKSKIGHVRK